jgi:2-keto-3-deoxygluconate permease
LAESISCVVGCHVGQFDDDVGQFLKPGETPTIPFFALALGTGMNLAVFLDLGVLTGGLFLGLATVTCTGLGNALVLRLIGERSTLGAAAEASTAGNTVQMAQDYESIQHVATAQVPISTMTTAVLCPLAVIFRDRLQRRRGVDAGTDKPRPDYGRCADQQPEK